MTDIMLELRCPKVNHLMSTENVTLQSKLFGFLLFVVFCFCFKLLQRWMLWGATFLEGYQVKHIRATICQKLICGSYLYKVTSTIFFMSEKEQNYI